MAYVLDEDEEQQGQEQNGSERVLSGESSDVSSGGGASGGGAAPSPKPTNSGSGWTNLTSYVKANEGADQRMGEAVKGAYQQKADAGAPKVQGYGSTARSAIDSGTAKDTGLVDKLSTVNAGSAAPTFTAEDYTNQTQGYLGPNDAYEVDGYGDAEGATKNLQSEAARAQDFEGRRGLLRDVYQTPQYSAGEQRLDSFITGAGAGGRQALDDIQTKSNEAQSGWQDLLGRIGGDIGRARTSSNDVKARTEDAYKGALDRVGSSITKQKTDLGARTASTQAAYAADTDAILHGNADQRSSALKRNGFGDADIPLVSRLLDEGVPLESLIKRAGDQSLGDIVSQGDQDVWSQLRSLGGGSDFDFAKSGNDGHGVDLNQGTVKLGREYADTEAALKKRYADAQKARDLEYDRIRGSLAGVLGSNDNATSSTLGLSPGILAKARTLGIEPERYLRRGPALQLGDVATDADRSGWGSLLSGLGIKGNLDLADHQDEGAGYSFDKAGFEAAVNGKFLQGTSKATPTTSAASAPASSPAKGTNVNEMTSSQLTGRAGEAASKLASGTASAVKSVKKPKFK